MGSWRACARINNYYTLQCGNEMTPIAIEQTERKKFTQWIEKNNNNNNAEKNDVLLKLNKENRHTNAKRERWVCGNHVSFRYAPHISCAMHISQARYSFPFTIANSSVCFARSEVACVFSYSSISSTRRTLRYVLWRCASMYKSELSSNKGNGNRNKVHNSNEKPII